MKILIGVDDSPSSHAAVDYVRAQQWPPGTRAVLVSSHEREPFAYTESYRVTQPTLDEIVEEDAARARNFVASVEHDLRNHGLDVETRVVNADPREAILAAAKDEHVDLIVLGSRPHSGIARLMHGRVASHVVRHALCNVLVVKQAA